MGTLAQIWRHPIKSHGRERLQSVDLYAGKTMPWDRAWAIAHETAKTGGSEWAPCANFSRGSKASQLMAINANLDEAAGTVTLTHPNLPQLTFAPDSDQAAFLEWVAPLMPTNRAASARILRVHERGMTDTPYPSISLNSLSSLSELSTAMDQDVSALRFRGNLWFDNLAPWVEREWIGKTVRIGSAELIVKENTVRCRATTANTNTGEYDLDTLTALKSNWGHQEFGVYAVVTKSGPIAQGDTIEVL